MLLAIDIGNTNTVLGLFCDDDLVEHWRVSTSVERTADENAILLRDLIQIARQPVEVSSAIISSVVPGAVDPLRDALQRRLGIQPTVVGSDLGEWMCIRYDNPREVGADRIVNAIAAYERHQDGVIIVDFGTATTFDCVSPQREYLGGAIAPGISISSDALHQHAAKLPRVALQRPERVVGRDTVTSMQAGLYYGNVGLVDGVVERMMQELPFRPRVVATGGLAGLIAAASRTIEDADEFLTLHGLRIMHQRPPATRTSI